MAEITVLIEDLRALKKERKRVRKELGKRSVQYAELTEEILELKDLIAFKSLHDPD